MTIQKVVSGVQALVILIVAGLAAGLGYHVGGWGAAVLLFFISMGIGVALDSLDQVVHKILR